MAKKKKTTPSSKPKTTTTQWFQQTKNLTIALFVLSFLIYANTFKHDFAQDDAIVITENMFTTKGFEGIPGLFKYDTFFGFFKVEGKAKLVSGGRYRPLTPAMFAVEYAIFGHNPQAMHVLNALWYAITVVVLYLLLLALFQARIKWDKELKNNVVYWLPLLAAFIFAVHPLHTEAVANIKGRDEVITLLGSLAALLLLVKAQASKKDILLIPAAILFFLGLLAKENAITFLAVAPLALYYFTNEPIAKILKYTAPLFVAAVVFLAIRGSILGWDFGSPSGELMNNPFLKLENGRWVHLSFAEKLPTITYTLGKYVQLLFAPYPLTHDYYPRQVELLSWSNIQVLLSLVLYIAMLFVAIKSLKQKSIDGFAIWFFLLTLSIVSNIVFPVGTNMSERFLFMPSVGFAIWLAFMAYRFLPKWNTRSMALGVVGLIFAVITIGRNPAWANNYSLFQTDIHNSPNSAKLRNAMAGELSVQYSKLPKEQQANNQSMLTEALGHINEAIRIHPTYKQAYFIKGNILNNLQRYEESIKAYEYAQKLDPDYEDAFENMMITYRDAGKYYGEQKGDLATALRYLEQAYKALPDDYQTIRLLGVAHGISGNGEKAIELFTKNTELNPDSAHAWFDLATAYFNSPFKEKGQEALAKAKAIDPDIEQKVRNGQ